MDNDKLNSLLKTYRALNPSKDLEKNLFAAITRLPEEAQEKLLSLPLWTWQLQSIAVAACLLIAFGLGNFEDIYNPGMIFFDMFPGGEGGLL